MNSIILNQYGIKFYRDTNNSLGARTTSQNHRNLCIFISSFEYPSNIINILNDINLASSGHYNQILDTEWSVDRGVNYIYSGIINDDETFSVSFNSDPDIDYPLTDIKTIFESWLEYMQH